MEKPTNWHHMSSGELCSALYTDSAAGLTETEAKRRLRKGKNTIWDVKGLSVKQYAVRTLTDFTTLLLVLCALIAAVFGSEPQAAAVCVMVVAARAARIAAVMAAQSVFEDSARNSVPRARVVRGGNVHTIPATDVVQGDLLILDCGDTVPCDIRLTAADSILVSEAGVTGNEGIVAKNSDPIPSGHSGEVPVGLRTNMLFASSTVVSGFGIGVAVACGRRTLVSAREGVISLCKSDGNVPSMEKIGEISRICSLGLLAAAFIITVAGVALGTRGLFEIFLPSVAMAAACLGEFMGAVGALSWAVAMKPDRDHTGEGMRSPAAAEEAAAAENIVLRSVDLLKSGRITLHSFYLDGTLTVMGTKDQRSPAPLLALACYAAGQTPGGALAQEGFGRRTRHMGPVSYEVIASLWRENGDKSEDPGYTVVQHIAAGEENSGGMDSVLLAKNNSFTFAALSKPAMLLSRCTHIRENEQVRAITDEDKKKILSYSAALRHRGVTVAAIGTRDSHYNSLRRISVLQSCLCFEGFIATADRMEEGALEALRKIKSSGGRITVFSDGSEEETAFAESEGVILTGDPCLTVEETASLHSMPEDESRIMLISTPTGAAGIRERLRILKLVCQTGKTAYIGYGVEDMWNMKCTEASFGTRAPGTAGIPQVIRTCAGGIVDSGGGGFLGAARIIDKCRAATVNIRRAVDYLIFSHAARLVLLLLCACANLPMLSAPHLVFLGLILDFAAAASMAWAPGCGQTCRGALPDSAPEILRYFLYGTEAAVMSVASPFIGRSVMRLAGLECSLGDGELLACVFCGLCLTLPFAAAEISGGYGLFSRKSDCGRLIWLPAALSAAVILATLAIPVADTAFLTVFPGWILLAFCLLPLLATVLTMSIVRAVLTKKEKRPDKDTFSGN